MLPLNWLFRFSGLHLLCSVCEKVAFGVPVGFEQGDVLKCFALLELFALKFERISIVEAKASSQTLPYSRQPMKSRYQSQESERAA